MDQTARKINILAFNEKKTRVIVVTDVASRGMDIPYLEYLIHYDFPDRFCFFLFFHLFFSSNFEVNTNLNNK